MDFGEKTRKRTSLNITSLVDILIVLLLFFMLTTEFVHMEVLNLKVSNDSDNSNNDIVKYPTISITLAGEGKFILNNEVYSLLQLKDKIRPLLQNTLDARVIILSKKKASVQEVVSAMDYIKSVGGKNVTIAEDK